MGWSGGQGWSFGVRVGAVAVVAATTQIALTVAFTSLAFRGELASELQLGLTSMFLGLLIAAVLGATRSGLGGHVIGPQDSGLLVLSVAVPTIAASTRAPAETMIVLLGLGSAAVGITLLVLGRFGWGRSVRFLPYPVMAGFLAGTGLVMGWSAIDLAWEGMAGDATGGTDRWVRLGVAMAVAILMAGIARSSWPTERLLPALVLGSIAVFHVGRWIDGMSRADGAARGWLLPVLPDGPILTNEWATSGSRADWSVVIEQLPTLLPLLVLAPLTLLLYLGALESVLDVDLDTDAEFRVAGGANLVAGAVGCAPSYTQFANTMLVQGMAGPNRVVPLVVGLSAIPVLFVGDPIVGLVPQPIVAGMLGFIAASFVLDWAWDLRRRVSRVELVTALVIAASIPAFGFLAGIALGLALTVFWFVIQAGRISGIRRIGDATSQRSTVDRSRAEERVLTELGGDVVIAELDGYLFFGTGDSVLRRLQARPGIDRVGWVVFDLTRVSGADSSAVASFGQLLRWARRSDIEVMWCHMAPRVRRSLSPLFADARGGAEFGDLDRALEATEAGRLATVALDESLDDAPPDLLDLVPELRDTAREVIYEAGDAIRRVGERGRGLTIIERGHVSVEGNAAGTRRRRLGPGAVLGELGIYGDAVASATVVADETCRAIEIDRRDIDELAARSPEAAGRLHRHLAGILSDRLLAANRTLDAYRAADAEPE